MSEPRRIVVGVLPGGGSVVYADGADPVVVALRQAHAALDAQRAEEERARLAAIADAARLADTRGARNMRRFKRAMSAMRFSR
jgi:hypothetical protein